MQRFSICYSLLKRNNSKPFLIQLITGDKKWVTYYKNERKRSWSKRERAPQTLTKPGLIWNKVKLRIWWDWKGILQYELLPKIKTIDSDVYCQQLMRLKKGIEKNRSELVNRQSVVFQRDNARQHSAKIERAWLGCIDSSSV